MTYAACLLTTWRPEGGVWVGSGQTWVPEAGLTLPSPYYLDHPPQYIPQSPTFPLPRELATLQAAAAQQQAPAPLPPVP